MSLKELLFKKGAPALATMLGGPLAGSAVRMITGAVNLGEDSTEDQIMAAIEADPQAMAAVRIAEIEAETAAGEANITNTQGARDMHARMKDWTTVVLSYMIVLMFSLLCAGILLAKFDTANRELLFLIVGYIGSDFKTMISFWFGSSKGSRAKDVMKYAPQSTGLIGKLFKR